MKQLKARVFTKNHSDQKFSLRRLRRISLRKTDNIMDSLMEYERMLENLKKGFKI
jgi:hypothetical protein